MTSSGLGRNRSRLAPARRLEKLPSLGPARSPKKVKDRRQLTCAGTGKDGAVEPRRARQGEATPTQGPISSPAAGPGGGRADLEPPHGLSRISSASALTRDPTPARRPARPSVPRGGAQRPARVRAEDAPGRGAGRRVPASDQAPDPRAPPPPPPARRPESAGGRREGAGSGHGGRRQTPTAPLSRHAPPRPRPTCAPAPAGAWPGAAHRDTAAAAVGLARSPPLRRTERPARRGGAQRSPRNPFVWLERRDVTRRPNRRLARGGAAEPGSRSAPAGILRHFGRWGCEEWGT